jgi:apolipoprotein N-acyltransferase
MLVFRRLEGTRALFAGWLTGSCIYITALYWIAGTIVRFSNLPPAAAAACVVVAGALWGFAVAAFAAGLGPIARRTGRHWPMAAAVWFTACEYLNPQLFPWTQAAPWYEVSSVFLVTSLGGSALLTFTIVLVNFALVAAIERLLDRPERVPGAAPGAAVAAVVFVVLCLGWSAHRERVVAAAEAETEDLRVALVQSNRDVFEMKNLRKENKSGITDDFAALTREALEQDGDIDVVVWPEGALWSHPAAKSNRAARALAREFDVELWTGASFRLSGERHPTPRRAGAFRLGRDGKVAGRYDKNVLLPFGEFMPLADTFPILKKIQGVGNYLGGDEMVVFEDAPAPFSFLICYEATRPRLVRRAARGGAKLLVNITYEAWFGDTDCPHQHFMLAANQAAATGIPLIRASTTGVTAVVDARGRPVESLDLFTRGVLVADVKPLAVPSVYVALGDWFAWLSILCGFSILGLGCRAEAVRLPLAAGSVLLVAAPLSWRINPTVPAADHAAWAFAVTAVLVSFVATRRRGENANLPSDPLP